MYRLLWYGTPVFRLELVSLHAEGEREREMLMYYLLWYPRF